MNPRDFLKMCEGFNLKWKRERDRDVNQMRLIRLIGSFIYNSNVKAGDRIIKDLDKLFYLPKLSWEEEQKKNIKVPTKEEIEEIKAWTLPRKLDDTTIENYLKKK